MSDFTGNAWTGTCKTEYFAGRVNKNNGRNGEENTFAPVLLSSVRVMTKSSHFLFSFFVPFTLIVSCHD